MTTTRQSVDAPPEATTQWQEILARHHNNQSVINRIADRLTAAGVTPQTLNHALTEPRLAYAWLTDTADSPPPPWVTDPIQRALICAELSEQDAVSQRRFADYRAAAISEAVDNTTVATVARAIGIRPQVVSRLHHRRRRDLIETAESWLHRTIAQPKGTDRP